MSVSEHLSSEMSISSDASSSENQLFSSENSFDSEFAFDKHTLEEYADMWFDDHEEEDTASNRETKRFLSVDFTEATYNIPYQVVDIQNDTCSEVMDDFEPWLVFEELFRCKQREVDMSDLVRKGLYNGEDHVLSTRGTFMGDGMSFIHLTLLQVGIVGFAFKDWPLGQSIGDDLVALKASLIECLRFCWQAEQLGMVFSKLNAINFDACTLCEAYACRVSDLETYKDLYGFKNVIYDDLMLIDIIKGSILSGRSKVKKDGVSPFIGHAKAASQQARWHPLTSVRERAKVLLWASNFHEASKLGTNMASLPRELGGIDMLLGKIVEFTDVDFQRNRLPWYEAILALDDFEEFLKYSMLLQGVYRSNPKGFAWENNFSVIKAICENVAIRRITNVRTSELTPERLKGGSIFKVLKNLEDEHNLVSIDRLSEQIARRDAHMKIWDGKITKSFMTLKINNVKERANKAWAVIKSNLTPIEPENFRSTSIYQLAKLYRERSWGVYVSRDDKAIDDIFAGMPSLWLDSSELRTVGTVLKYSSDDE